MSKVTVIGPTAGTVKLRELACGEGFTEPLSGRLYIRLGKNYEDFRCFRFTPSLGMTMLRGDLLVRQANIKVEWSFE